MSWQQDERRIGLLAENAAAIQAQNETVKSGWNKRHIVELSISQVQSTVAAFVIRQLDK